MDLIDLYFKESECRRAVGCSVSLVQAKGVTRDETKREKGKKDRRKEKKRVRAEFA
jgi:hypothetical protein